MGHNTWASLSNQDFDKNNSPSPPQGLKGVSLCKTMPETQRVECFCQNHSFHKSVSGVIPFALMLSWGKEGHFIQRSDSNCWNPIVGDHFRAAFSAREMRWPSKHSPIHTIYSISPFYWMKHYSICLKRVKRITNDIKCECKKSIFCNMLLQGGLIFWYKICFH